MTIIKTFIIFYNKNETRTGRDCDVTQLELVFALPDDEERDRWVDPHRLVEGHVQILQLLDAVVVRMVRVLKKTSFY